jgi:hypothetical protein
MDYKKFRVRTPVKSFRDLEVYQLATKLSAQIYNLVVPKDKPELDIEMKTLKENSKLIINLLVESYGDKFNDMRLAAKKMEIISQTINMIIAKIDFFNALIEDERLRENLLEILKKYQRLKIKVLNLKRAWERVFLK